jgi:hypothetical protein
MTASKQQKQTADANGVTRVRDDVLEAVKIRAALSTSLITATGTAVVAGLAVVAFATQLHRVEAPALGFWAGASVAFFTSAVAGGLAIRQLTASGSTGDWGLRVPSKRYTVQILTFFLAAALLSIGTAIAFNDPSRASRDDDQDRLIRSSTEN